MLCFVLARLLAALVATSGGLAACGAVTPQTGDARNDASVGTDDAAVPITDASFDVTENDANADGAPAVPSDGLALWLRSDLGITVDPTSRAVVRWADQSPNHRDATHELVGSGPYVDTAWPGRPGAPVVYFPGPGPEPPVANMALDLGFLAGAGGFVLFLATSGGGLVLNAGAPPGACCGSAGARVQLDIGSSVTLDRACGSVTTPVASSQPVLTRVTYSPSTALYGLAINGGPVHDDAAESCAGAAAPRALDVNATLGTVFGGRVAEVIAFDRVLTPTEISSVESYLRGRWATP
jgi:hypothetical protein